MALRKVYIQHREFVPDVAEILGRNVIDIEYYFDRAQILGELCSFETEMTNEQAKEIDRRAMERRKAPKSGGTRVQVSRRRDP